MNPAMFEDGDFAYWYLLSREFGCYGRAVVLWERGQLTFPALGAA